MSPPKKILSLLATFLSLTAGTEAQTLGWGTSASSMPLGYFSNGSPTGTALIWNVGYFANNFVPTFSNHSQWVANFVIVDTAREMFSDPFYAVDGFKVDTGVAPDGITPTNAAGQQIWIFAYNDITKIGTPQGEALLFRQNGLAFPSAPNIESVDIADNLLDAGDDAFTIVWGHLERRRGTTGGQIAGGGVYSSPLTDTTTESWEAQTATWPSSPPTPYQVASWTIANPNLRNEADDADGDQRSNFIEHASGTAMSLSDADFAMVGPVNPISATITLPAARPSDVRYTIQYNENLSNIWQELSRCVGTGAWVGASPVSTTPVAPSRESIVFTTPTTTRGFFRLKFERVAP
jgi:hypothetical protein